MTRRTAPNRNDALVQADGRPSRLFASTIENLVDDVNDQIALPINTQTSDYTLVLDDRVIRFTGSTSLTMTIPDSESVPFEVGTLVKVYNDTSADLTVEIDTDTLTFEEDGTTGPRTIAAGGSGEFFLIALTSWKASGQQIT